MTEHILGLGRCAADSEGQHHDDAAAQDEQDRYDDSHDRTPSKRASYSMMHIFAGVVQSIGNAVGFSCGPLSGAGNEPGKPKKKIGIAMDADGNPVHSPDNPVSIPAPLDPKSPLDQFQCLTGI